MLCKNRVLLVMPWAVIKVVKHGIHVDSLKLQTGDVFVDT